MDVDQAVRQWSSNHSGKKVGFGESVEHRGPEKNHHGGEEDPVCERTNLHPGNHLLPHRVCCHMGLLLLSMGPEQTKMTCSSSMTQNRWNERENFFNSRRASCSHQAANRADVLLRRGNRRHDLVHRVAVGGVARQMVLIQDGEDHRLPTGALQIAAQRAALAVGALFWRRRVPSAELWLTGPPKSHPRRR